MLILFGIALGIMIGLFGSFVPTAHAVMILIRLSAYGFWTKVKALERMSIPATLSMHGFLVNPDIVPNGCPASLAHA